MKLRLALDYRPALLSSTGIARSVRELARALAAEPDVELHLFAHSLARARRGDGLPAAARLHRLPVPGRSLGALARLGLGAEQLAGSVPLFHWTDYVHPPVRRARCVLTIHDLAFATDETFHGREQSRTLLERTRAAAAQARLTVTPTHATGEAVMHHLGVPRDRVRVVPFGADHARAAAGGHPFAGRPYLLSIGTIEPRKNHLRLLEALRLLRDPPFLIVVGSPGWECRELVRALRQAQAQNLLRWLPSLDDGALFRCVLHARALVYPSLLEGFGFPPLEALSLGTPVVAGDTAALREVLADAACFCDPARAEDIAAALERVLHDQTLRMRLVTLGRARAQAFTWRASAAGYLSAYREALA